MNQNYEEVMHREFFFKTSFYLNRQQLLNYDFEIL
jgi:mannose/fructose/N-acetylgalactosamine-specific phosphotransferase system component IID